MLEALAPRVRGEIDWDWVAAAVLDVLRPEFLIRMIVFWAMAAASGAALGVALGRLRTSAPDDLATATDR